MLQTVEPTETVQIVDLWFEQTLKDHPFLDREELKERIPIMLEHALPQAETWVYKQDEQVLGFITLEADMISTLNVAEEMHRQSVGTMLLNKAKEQRTSLSIHVYTCNEAAVKFFTASGFEALYEQEDTETGEPEILMRWVAS